MMTDRKSGEHSCDQTILGLPSKTTKAIHFFAVVITAIGVVVGFVVTYCEFQNQQKQRWLQLNTALANLAAQEKPDITSPFIHNNLKWMHQEGFPMTGIAVPGTIFHMAEFENVVWQSVDMNEVKFVCIDQDDDKIDNWKEGDPKISLCTRLRKAYFTGASLREARFNYADLREADFTAASLSEAKIDNSVVSGAKFLELQKSALRGIEIKHSDFTNVQFSPDPKAQFRCKVNYEKCVELYRSDFSSAEMNNALFRGTKIKEVDFTGAELKEAHFDCERDRNGEKPCTTLENVCLRDAKLAGAEFEDVTISNADFTDAELAGAEFTNVKFDRVVLTEEQEKAAKKFDDESRASLHEGRVRLVSENSRDIPCSEDWDRHIRKWMDGIAL